MIDRYTHPAWRMVISAILIAASIAAMAPVAWIAGLSLRQGGDVFSNSVVPASFHPENYITAWTEFGLFGLLLNSIIVTGASVLVCVVCAVLAAYGFSRLRFRGSEALFIIILLGLMIPPAVR